MAGLARSLPPPIHSSGSDDFSSQPHPAPVQLQVALPSQQSTAPGKVKTINGGKTLALQTDSEGKIRYDAIAKYGTREGTYVQSSHRDLVPLAKRTELSERDKEMERPSDDLVQSTTDRTRSALEKLTAGRIAAARPTTVALKDTSKSEYIRYTPASTSETGKQRIIKMTEVQEDPLEPPRFKHKKIPKANTEPPPPVLQSPPRRATVQDQKDWQIPPCISNWKNNKGYTIPLDKRLAADGRGLQDVHINDNFAKFSEALYIADRHAREEVRERSVMQQRLAQKEKAAKEENLRLLAQRARDERNGIIPSAAAASGLAGGAPPTMKGVGLAGYGSGSDSDASSDEDEDKEDRKRSGRPAASRTARSSSSSGSESESEAEDEEARERDKIRKEKRKEREREMRLNNMGTEQRAKMLMKEQNRDISEKIALGLAKPTQSKEAQLDSRLFNREQYSGNFGESDSYNIYDKPLFHGSSAAAAIYKPRGNNANDEQFGGGTEEGITSALSNDRFALGVKGFEGSATQELREGPVQFEKDVSLSMNDMQQDDPFGLNQFMDEAKKGSKRGLDTSGGDANKKARHD